MDGNCLCNVPGMEGMVGAMVCCGYGMYGGCKGGMNIVTVVGIVVCYCLA